ncbi:MAG: hypothetical protein Fur002_13570 [Anaerolineales bacterium]
MPVVLEAATSTFAVSSPVPTFTSTPASLAGARFISEFAPSGWDVASGYLSPAQINAAVAALEGEDVPRFRQKVINGFLLSVEQQEGGQVFSVLSPAQAENNRLVPLTVKSVTQTPILSTHAILLEDYFEINFPAEFAKWKAQGAEEEDMRYAAIVTVTWATKYGPLRVSYKASGKYISDAGKYAGRADLIRLCMFESTVEHFYASGTLTKNWFPFPIVGLEGITPLGERGELKSDTFGWTPMRDFAAAEADTLTQVAEQVSGLAIESKETLAQIQAAFDRAFFPVHCNEVRVK